MTMRWPGRSSRREGAARDRLAAHRDGETDSTAGSLGGPAGELESHRGDLRQVTLPIDRDGRPEDRLVDVDPEGEQPDPGMMGLAIDQGQEVLLDVLVARWFLTLLFLLEAERDLVEGDDPPVVIPRLDQDVLAAPVPGGQALEVVAADQQHADAALADDLPVFAGQRQEPRIAPERRRGQAPRHAVDDVVDDLEAGRPTGGEDRIRQ